jgi:hypothetical protein
MSKQDQRAFELVLNQSLASASALPQFLAKRRRLVLIVF